MLKSATKMTRQELHDLLTKMSEEAYRADVKLVQLTRERDLLAAENAQMSMALDHLVASADKEGTPGWWRIVATRWQMEATRLRDAIMYGLLDGGWSGDSMRKLLKNAIAIVDADRPPKKAPKPEAQL